MREDTEWSPFEHKIAAALQAIQTQPTNACLEPDSLLILAEQGEDAPDYAQQMAHVAACAFCRPEYVQMRADLLEVEQMRAQINAPLALMPQADQTQAAQTQTGQAPAPPPTTEPQQQMTAATERATVAPRPSFWQRLTAPRILAPAFAASALLAAVSLKVGYTVQQQNMSLARELTQVRNQDTALSKQKYDYNALSKQQKYGQYTYATKSGQDEHVAIPGVFGGDGTTDPHPPLILPKPDQSTNDSAQADRQLAEARRQLQAEQAQNAQSAQRLKQAQARLRQEELLNQKLVAAAGKQNNAPVVKPNGTHPALPDINLYPREMIARAAPSPEVEALLKQQEASGVRSGSEDAAQSIELLSPQASVILEPRPLLRWRSVEGAAYYNVFGLEVSRAANGGLDYKKLAWMPTPVRATGTQYQIEHALAPGKVYSWQVAAYRDAESKPFALATINFVAADAAQATATKQLADLQFAAARSLEAQQEWERAESQYRAISSNIPDVYEQAQARIAALEKRPKRRP